MKNQDYRKRALGAEFFVASHFSYAGFEAIMTPESTTGDLVITGHNEEKVIYPIRIEVKSTSYKFCQKTQNYKESIKWEIRKKNKNYYKKDSVKKPEKFDSYKIDEVDYFALVFGDSIKADGFVLLKNNGNIASKTLKIKEATSEYHFTILNLSDNPNDFIIKEIGLEAPLRYKSKNFFDLKDVSNILNLDTKTIIRYIENHIIPYPIQLNGNFNDSLTLWSKTQIEDFIESRPKAF